MAKNEWDHNFSDVICAKVKVTELTEIQARLLISLSATLTFTLPVYPVKVDVLIEFYEFLIYTLVRENVSDLVVEKSSWNYLSAI